MILIVTFSTIVGVGICVAYGLYVYVRDLG